MLKDTPSWALLPAETPSSIRRLLHRCLDRNGAASDFRVAGLCGCVTSFPRRSGAFRCEIAPVADRMAYTIMIVIRNIQSVPVDRKKRSGQ